MMVPEFIASLSEQATQIISKVCRQQIPHNVGNCILVIVPICGREGSQQEYRKVRAALAAFRRKGVAVPMTEYEIPGTEIPCSLPEHGNEVIFRCLALETSSVEGIKDVLKEVLWPIDEHEKRQLDSSLIKQNDSAALQMLIDQPGRGLTVEEIRSLTLHRSLKHHCILSLSRIQQMKDIMTHSFDHGGGHFYRYRLCLRKIQGAKHPISKLSEFLRQLNLDCPNHFFKTGPRISAIQCDISPIAEIAWQSMLPELARKGIEQKRFKSAHDNVEILCLEEDPGAIAVEIPIWWERDEMGLFQKCFQSTGPLTGHIDILRMSGDTIEIWDYKPDAEVNTKVGMQVLLYALVLAIRTGLPLTQFRCGFFDMQTAWTFSPAFASMRPAIKP